MTSKWLRYLLLIMLASAAFGQTSPVFDVERVFNLTNTTTTQGIQEIVNTVRVTADVQNIAFDESARTITVRGTSDRLALTGWLLPQLDRAAGPQSPQNGAPPDYRLGGSSDAVVRVYYVESLTTPQEMQEMINAIRSIFEVQRIAACTGPRAIAVRGTAEQIAGTSWIIAGLDVAVHRPHPATPPSFTLTRPPTITHPYDTDAKIFYLTPSFTPQATQELINAIRSVAELQRVVSFNRDNAIVARGMPDNMAMTEWLIHALDKPAPVADAASVTSTQYSGGASNGVMRVFYLPPASPEALQDCVKQVRSTSRMQRVVGVTGPRAIVMRGTEGQVAIAEKLLQDTKM